MTQPAREAYGYDLGSYHCAVTTASEDAQLWFDRGLIWSYAFNHEEAIECFEQAILSDPKFAMAYWGLAYALGPNYNRSWEHFDDLEATLLRIRKAASLATVNAASVSSVERAIINALQSRYPEDHTKPDSLIWNKGSAEALKAVYTEFPDNLEVAALYADALMNLTPWQLWDLKSGQPAEGARTLEAKQVIERALAQKDALTHPGLLHLYIHLMEMSSTPEVALPVANHLRGLVPDSGHLNHMPSHIDVLCGDYQNVVASNSAAIEADEKYLAREGSLNFYTLYRVHNYHFRIYGAMFAGQSKVALATVAQLEAAISEELLRVKSPPMDDLLEGFLITRMHVLIRFGRWQDILDLALPSDSKLYCVTTAMMHYAKGIALAATGKIDEAGHERALYGQAIQRVPSTRTLFNNKLVDIFAIATAMLDGELEYRRGNFDVAFAHLLQAGKLDDSLPYDEPWGWMQPTRHAYGALLLEQGRLEEAVAVYSADLGRDETLPRALRHPNNVWALHGYHECLMKLGRLDDARIIEPQLAVAVAVADVPIRSSCFCRLTESKTVGEEKS